MPRDRADATDPLIRELRRWGFATLNRYVANEDGPSAGDSVLQRTRDLAPGTRENFERELVGRDGTDRRALMAQRAGVRGLTVVPMWACDPVRATNDAAPPHDRPNVAADRLPDDLLWIERAVARLSRQQPLRALCVREEFCGVGTQRMKCARVERAYGGRLSVWMYRRELAAGVEWVRGVGGVAWG